MARVLVQAQTLAGAYPALPVTSATDLAMQAADPSLYNYTPLVSGKTVLIAQNTDSGPHNVTVSSVVDPQNRLGDIVEALPAAGLHIYGPFQNPGWAQAGSQLWFAAADVTVKFAVVTLP